MRIQHWESSNYSGPAKKVETRHPPLTKNTSSQTHAVYADWLGDHAFTKIHGSRFAYIVGEMARGIATPRMVIAAAQAGLVGFYGSAGLKPETIASGLDEIEAALGKGAPAWGANLIHTPQQPGYERAVVDLFLSRGVARVSASAFMQLSPEIVRYSAAGVSRADDGTITRSTHVFAKVSRAEVARQFMAPAPDAILKQLVARADITPEQAEIAASVPVALDITAEADSGGHTDNRAAGPLFSSLVQARREVCEIHNLNGDDIRIGLGGGIGTPWAAAAAFQMGAAYIITGSVNQAAAESGLSLAGRKLLADAGPADVAMAPAADMFEQGVEVQVLKRGTLFAMRGCRMREIYRTRTGFADCTPQEQAFIEAALGETYASAWEKTRAFMAGTNPKELEKAEADLRHQLALVFRRYLFFGAQWAREGEESRLRDYQIWCGPAMGAFNEWVKGSPLEALENRTVKQIALNLMDGAAHLTGLQARRARGENIPQSAFDYRAGLFE
ncbi:PfaD family polyunsaturated fatty acid/polyketide biosynthesis protein [Henriciella barbarensis]|uniref:PfaD family polyunsaturated fatty acid/polyketide biosynthesis protein n=1 Tax=Henriciella barbarensis TaxID=86342 RepID=A0A399QYK5_9PROT|nr:PfaD family polyunsaturated fatty acid/polyketide biosynthesis protein [Henriciella barbarensis]RIJ23314.1 PfaD family polyunsaturated fatty acid/polyketide biosynthesis protein [Henriciella barbarensis]